jgi:hypothetical protein
MGLLPCSFCLVNLGRLYRMKESNTELPSPGSLHQRIPYLTLPYGIPVLGETTDR